MKPIDAYILGVLVGSIGNAKDGVALRCSDICDAAKVSNIQLLSSLNKLRAASLINHVYFGKDMVAITPPRVVPELIKEQVVA